MQKEVVISDPPAWLGSKAGVTDAVLPPYTPIQVKGDAARRALERVGAHVPAGRASACPEQIVSRDAPLLSGPARLRAVVEGQGSRHGPGGAADSPAQPGRWRWNKPLPAGR